MENKSKTNNSKIKINFASPDEIISWCAGKYKEVTEPETINYKTLKPEKNGLFDERIFGPTKNYECSCGRYKKVINKGKICEKCGVEITEAIVRRQRMGYIALNEPVAHIWMFKASPSKIALVLNMKAKELDEVIYFVSYVVLNPGHAIGLKEAMVLDLGNAKTSQATRIKLIKILKSILKDLKEDTFAHQRATEMIDELMDTSLPFSMDECADLIKKYTGAEFGIGAAAIEILLKNLDFKKEINKIQETLVSKKVGTDYAKSIKRLETLVAFHNSSAKPEWMILKNIPVIPPDIRPIIQLDGGRFTSSEINDLYRRIIIRNKRLKKIKEMGAPSVIVNNEKRMLQESVDALIDNERKPRPVTGKDKRALKSLTSILKGKQGRFRQNLLGKRVDYSGRSVIVIGPHLKMYQCGLPRDMAVVLFKPFIIQHLVKNELAANIKVAEIMIENKEEPIWDALEQVIKTRPVLLNRAPTLHRLGIQAFEPVLVKGKAIHLHPLVTTAFNADFDGDQMAVHLPISPEAVAEARLLMLGSRSILGPKDGLPIVTPGQDLVLGNYYLTQEEKNLNGQGHLFKDANEAILAYETQKISLNALIGVPVYSLKNKTFKEEEQNKILVTTVGKLIFNGIFNETFPYLNEPSIENLYELSSKNMINFGDDINQYINNKWSLNQPFKKKTLSNIIDKYFKMYRSDKTAEMLDNMKNLGFKFSGLSGVTISAGDVRPFTEKKILFEEADKKIKQIHRFYELGFQTREEKKQAVCKVWNEVKNKVSEQIEVNMKLDPKNPIFMMADSGARGNISNFTQLVGMRGLMNNPKGETIELPIKSSFREGLTVSEFFNSTHGARKGMADVALKTADSGYLTRRLVDVSQDVIVTEKKCNSKKGFVVSDIVDDEHKNIIVPLFDRIKGRFNLYDIKLKNKVVPAETLINDELAQEIIDNKIDKIVIRTVLTCESNRGVCQHCYGKDLATSELVKIGEAVGIIAAQSIGEPGTQLTMRTFHTGGVAGGVDITQGLPRIKELLDVTTPKGLVAIISEINGKIEKIKEENGFYTIYVKSPHDERKYKTQFNAPVIVKKGDTVVPGQRLTDGSIDIKELLEVANVEEVQNYILKEVQTVYRLQGIGISDKYIEIIIRQMLKKVKIVDAGGTNLLCGEVISIKQYKEITKEAIMNFKKPPLVKRTIFGIKKAPLESESFLSAASFQDTTRVLVKAIIKGKEDNLVGLKENTILGRLIPAGTGLESPEKLLKQAEDVKNYEY
ncbi:DNA-directed RNA polymerase subunit beta' [Spiroplasma endosymbiont of Amphibalanus improvisus]|uniref:DNA-directed RNA polymerase subunit beta' n=1 Tax=Spiroplasma endosymbiont of Amphibalanus improvisus TaxID=3066327 RepID=UPI00313EB916